MPNLCILDPERRELYGSVLSLMTAKGWSITFANCLQDIEAADFCLITDDFHPHHITKLIAAKYKGTPVLHIMDGVCEWRNIWENPRTQSGNRGVPFLQPLLAQKVACLGPSQARLMESLGAHHGQCEVTGSPRLDQLIEHLNDSSWERGRNNVVTIATARSPGFNEIQQLAVKRALEDLNQLLKKVPKTLMQVVWRLGDLAYLPEQAEGEVSLIGSESLESILQKTNVFITTPSTSALEAMLLGIPTCLIDYTNSPKFIQTAWNITSKQNISGELASMLDPPEQRLHFQRFLLHDQLRCDGQASPRVVELISKMWDLASSLKHQNSPCRFPAAMVDSNQKINPKTMYLYRPELLFPAHPSFKRSDFEDLRAENGTLLIRVASLEKLATDLENSNNNCKGQYRSIQEELYQERLLRLITLRQTLLDEANLTLEKEGSNVWIWGTGSVSKSVLNFFGGLKPKIKGFIESKPSYRTFDSKPILSPKEFELLVPNNAKIKLVVATSFYQDIINHSCLEKKGFVQIYIINFTISLGLHC